MAILEPHIPFYRKVFDVPGLLAEPFLMLGYQQILGHGDAEDFDFPDVVELLAARGVGEVTTLDLFDDRADLRYDLNFPVPANEHDRYATVFDIGTLEHVFDSRQCLESSLRMVRPGGHYFGHTPVKGYYRHGFHTFHPAFLRLALKENGFDILYLKYSSEGGEPLDRPEHGDDVLLWIVGRKTAPMGEFRIPQQPLWIDHYSPSTGPG